jgi:NDP-4-keto-2,6-dideoxyhexose 3-C-methyltransferase
MMGAGYSDIAKCRICGSTQFGDIIDFGLQALASRFPRVGEPDPLTAPLVLVECIECGLVQLRHSVDSKELYTYTYGYQSGINSSMQNHLSGIACWIQKQCNLKSGDIVLDIGCNDGTLLKSYSIGGLQRYGIDLIAGKFKEQYPADIAVRESAFSTEAFRALCGDEKAKVITSIAMFYDLESPGDFVSGIKKTLSPEGVWVLEQSYLPSMLETNSYDTVCHEHLEYYSLRQIEWLANDHGLRVFDVERNATNGGSFRLAVCHENGPYESNKDHPIVRWSLPTALMRSMSCPKT